MYNKKTIYSSVCRTKYITLLLYLNISLEKIEVKNNFTPLIKRKHFTDVDHIYIFEPHNEQKVN